MNNPVSASPQTWVEINLSALLHNLRLFADRFPPQVKVILSAKKNAYGHGLFQVAQSVASEEQVMALGTATGEEAVWLREQGITAPILCFSVLRGEELKAAIHHDISLTITDAADADRAEAAARELGKKAKSHLKIDTGMGRLGRLPGEIDVASLVGRNHLALDAVYTHLSDAWNNPAWGSDQLDRLEQFMSDPLLRGLMVHIGGSDCLSLSERITSGGVRSGIAIYGYHPGLIGLKPVMTFKTRVIYRRRVPKGTRISYGGTFTTTRETELALVGAGYGNGYPRIISNRGQVLINGSRCPILGRVCMDQMVVDVSAIPKVAVGDEVVLFGEQGGATLGADEVAAWAETIPYELLCLAGQINPRRYVEV